MDFSDWVHNFPGSITALQQSIRGTILQFEPRLKNVSVRYTPSEDPLSLRFEITGQPVDKSSRQTLRFRTQLSPGGRVEVW